MPLIAGERVFFPATRTFPFWAVTKGYLNCKLPRITPMLKFTLSALTAMTLVGAFAMPVHAASPQAMARAGDGYTDTREALQPVHFSRWSHYHKCNPSPCGKLKYRHKKGHGWGSPSTSGPKFRSK